MATSTSQEPFPPNEKPPIGDTGPEKMDKEETKVGNKRKLPDIVKAEPVLLEVKPKPRYVDVSTQTNVGNAKVEVIENEIYAQKELQLRDEIEIMRDPRYVVTLPDSESESIKIESVMDDEDEHDSDPEIEPVAVENSVRNLPEMIRYNKYHHVTIHNAVYDSRIEDSDEDTDSDDEATEESTQTDDDGDENTNDASSNNNDDEGSSCSSNGSFDHERSHEYNKSSDESTVSSNQFYDDVENNENLEIFTCIDVGLLDMEPSSPNREGNAAKRSGSPSTSTNIKVKKQKVAEDSGERNFDLDYDEPEHFAAGTSQYLGLDAQNDESDVESTDDEQLVMDFTNLHTMENSTSQSSGLNLAAGLAHGIVESVVFVDESFMEDIELGPENDNEIIQIIQAIAVSQVLPEEN